MKPCTKKEFFAARASQQDRVSISSPVILAVFSEIGGFFARGGRSTPVSLLLTAGLLACCLGIQFAQSRVWAVLLLVLGCGNLVLGAPVTGGVLAGVLLGAGIWSVVGTFRLHRRYLAFLTDPDEKENKEGDGRGSG